VQTPAQQRRRIELLAKQWDVYQQLMVTSDYAELVAREEPVAVSLDDPGLLGIFYSSLGHCQYYAGDLDKLDRNRNKGRGALRGDWQRRRGRACLHVRGNGAASGEETSSGLSHSRTK
jgi:hypothetical protein